jgi:hypothetical protein
MEAQQIDVRRVRVIAAVALSVACASAGFMGGWFAARLAPAETPVAAGSADRPVTEARVEPKTTAATAEKEKTSAVPSDASKDQDQATADQNTISSDSARETVAGATIINAGSIEGKAKAREASAPSQPMTSQALTRPATSQADPEPASDPPNQESVPKRTADEEMLARCSRRYSSFRASDGTYQPYDGGPRKLCSLLR